MSDRLVGTKRTSIKNLYPKGADNQVLTMNGSEVVWETPSGGGGGSGDVVGPASSTDNAVARFDSTTGKLLQNSGVTIDDSGNIATSGTIDGRDISVDGAKLDGIAAGAEVNTVDSVNSQTGAVVLDADDIDDTSTSHKFVTASDLTTLSNTSGTNTGDQDLSSYATTAAVAAGYQPLDTQLTSIAGLVPGLEGRMITSNGLGGYQISTTANVRGYLNVEDGADVTDTTNVTAAGALMDSEVTNLAQVKAFDSADYATAAQGSTADSALQDVVDDTTPQLGGTLDCNNNNIQEVKSATFNGVVADGTLGASKTIDWGAGNIHSGTLSANCTLSFTAPSGPANLSFIVTQDTTARTITWPAAVKWPDATAPTLSTGSGDVDIITFLYDGTNYYGAFLGNFS